MNSNSDLNDLVVENKIYSKSDIDLIDSYTLPNHVAIVMDGNRRWAKDKGIPIEFGHIQGAKQLDLIVRASIELGIKILTVYSFSTENWRRPKVEVDKIMKILNKHLISKKNDLIMENVRFQTIGQISRLPLSTQLHIKDLKESTKHCNAIDLILALNYGDRKSTRLNSSH